MLRDDDSRLAEFQQANARFKGSLARCRALVSVYRARLGTPAMDGPSAFGWTRQGEPANDSGVATQDRADQALTGANR